MGRLSCTTHTQSLVPSQRFQRPAGAGQGKPSGSSHWLAVPPLCAVVLTCVVLGWADTASAARSPTAPLPSSAVIDFSEDEFQFRFGTSADDRNVWLYIPATAKSVRALLLLQQNVVEQMISVHPVIRKACNANDIAIAWCQPGFDAQFEGDAQASHALIQQRFRAAGRTIGYPELGDVPLITFGHSATCGYAQRSAEARPERVLAAIVTHGWNGVDSFRNYKGPVALFIGPVWEMGQQNKAITNPRGMNSLKKVRQKLAENWMPISVIDQFGSGHFDYADDVVEFLAMYIDKAAKARLDAAGKLRDVALNTGHIIPDLPAASAAPLTVKPYAEASERERSGAPWFFDKELAEMAAGIIYGNGPWDRAGQLIGFNYPDGTPAPFGKSGLVNPVPYSIVPGTSQIQFFPVLLEALPAGFKEEGRTLARCSDRTITIEYDNGPYIHRDRDGAYRIKANRGADSGYIVARNRGDRKVRPAVQPTYLSLGGAAVAGAIPLDNPGDQRVGAAIALKNVSRADTFVGYYVDHGPARVVGEKLVILPLPPNTPGPVEVELVAYSLRQTISGRVSVMFKVWREDEK